MKRGLQRAGGGAADQFDTADPVRFGIALEPVQQGDIIFIEREDKLAGIRGRDAMFRAIGVELDTGLGQSAARRLPGR